ncbi:MAG: TetR/AcrR family transcriptional regulator [Myxococcota bacterium]|nr:TetR/AcrR family transcriptional regulator [Myxococcota bacterium]
MAAARVFGAKGLAKAKVSDIAAAAGLSHGLVYHYFESKDAIFGAIVDQMIQKVDADLAGDSDLPAIARIVAGIERSRNRVCAGGVEPGRVVAQAMMQGVMPEHLRARLLEHFRALHGRVARLIAEAQRDGDVEDDVDSVELASALVCLMRGMSIRTPGMPELPFPVPRTDTILRLLRPAQAAQQTTPARKGAAARGSNARRR